MNNLLKLTGSGGPDDDDNNPDDVANMQSSLTELGHTPFHTSFRDGDPPVREIERVQIDGDLKIDGRAKPGGETERTINNELLRKRDEDRRTQGGLLSDPRVRKPVGMAEVGKSNTVRDLARTEDALKRIGRAPVNEHRPTDLMRAHAVGEQILKVQTAAGLDRDGVMSPGGPTERVIMQELERNRQLAPAAVTDAAKAVNQVVGAAAGIFDRVFAPVLSEASNNSPPPQTAHNNLSQSKTADGIAQLHSKSAPKQLASGHHVRGYTPQNQMFVPKLPAKPAAYDGRQILFGELKSKADDIARRKSLGSLDLGAFVRKAATEIASKPGAIERNAIATRLLRDLDKMMPRNDSVAGKLKSMIEAGIRMAAASPTSNSLDTILSEAIGKSSTQAVAEMIALENEVASWVPYFRNEDQPFLADMIQKWLSGDDSMIVVDPAWLRKSNPIQGGEKKVRGHFESWLKGELEPSQDAPDEVLHPKIGTLRKGQVLQKSAKWAAAFTVGPVGSDKGKTINQTQITSTGSFEFRRNGSAIQFTGIVSHKWHDDFDWDPNKPLIVPTRNLTATQEVVLPLRRFGRAKDFSMESRWRQRVTGDLVRTGNRWIIRNLQWRDLP